MKLEMRKKFRGQPRAFFVFTITPTSGGELMSIQRSQRFGNTLDNDEVMAEALGDLAEGQGASELDLEARVQELIAIASRKYQISFTRAHAEELILENMEAPAERIAGDVWFEMEEAAQQSLMDEMDLYDLYDPVDYELDYGFAD